MPRLSKRQWKDLDRREKRVLKVVDEQPDMHFNRLADVVESQMARRTLRKKVNELRKDGYLIQIELRGKKHYLRPSKRIYTLNEFQSNARKLRADLRVRIKWFANHYRKLPRQERVKIATKVCEIILWQLRNLTILSFYFPLHRDHHQMLEEEYKSFFRSIMAIVNEGSFAKQTRDSTYDRLLEPHLTYDSTN